MRKSVASIALISREAHGQTLWLAQWNQGWRSFSFVGGHKREQESFRECVIREIEEELGLREGQDVRIALTPLKAVAYIDVSRRTGEETEYDIALFEVSLIGVGARTAIDANHANRWLSEPEILRGLCDDGKAVSPTPRRFLQQLGYLARAGDAKMSADVDQIFDATADVDESRREQVERNEN